MDEKQTNLIMYRYINARSMKDQTLAREICKKIGIEYDIPILENDVISILEDNIAAVKKYSRCRYCEQIGNYKKTILR